MVAAVGNGGDVARPVVVDDGGGEQTTIVGCLMMPIEPWETLRLDLGMGSIHSPIIFISLMFIID